MKREGEKVSKCEFHAYITMSATNYKYKNKAIKFQAELRYSIDKIGATRKKWDKQRRHFSAKQQLKCNFTFHKKWRRMKKKHKNKKLLYHFCHLQEEHLQMNFKVQINPIILIYFQQEIPISVIVIFKSRLKVFLK